MSSVTCSRSPALSPCHPSAHHRLGSSELLFRSFRLHADGSLYAEARPWALDVSSLGSERQGSVTDAELLMRRRERHRLLRQQRQQQAQQPERSRGNGHEGEDPEQQQWESDSNEGDDGQAEERQQAQPASLHRAAAGQGVRRRRRGLLQKEDARYPVRDTGYWPNNAVVQMYFVTTGTNTATSCSGTWVSGYDVLTATHCVYNWAAGATYTNFVVSRARGHYKETCCLLRPAPGRGAMAAHRAWRGGGCFGSSAALNVRA